MSFFKPKLRTYKRTYIQSSVPKTSQLGFSKSTHVIAARLHACLHEAPECLPHPLVLEDEAASRVFQQETAVASCDHHHDQSCPADEEAIYVNQRPFILGVRLSRLFLLLGEHCMFIGDRDYLKGALTTLGVGSAKLVYQPDCCRDFVSNFCQGRFPEANRPI